MIGDPRSQRREQPKLVHLGELHEPAPQVVGAHPLRSHPHELRPATKQVDLRDEESDQHEGPPIGAVVRGRRATTQSPDVAGARGGEYDEREDADLEPSFVGAGAPQRGFQRRDVIQEQRRREGGRPHPPTEGDEYE